MFTRYNKNKKQRAIKNHVLPMRKGCARGSGGGGREQLSSVLQDLPVPES